jgi:hypothetical protein
MTRTFFALLCLSLFSLTAAYAADAMSSMIGNTVSVIDPDGMDSRFQYAADGTFKLNVPAADFKSDGTWSLDGQGKICRNYADDIPGVPKPDCDAEPVTAHAIGQPWTSTNRGKTYRIVILSGLQ